MGKARTAGSFLGGIANNPGIIAIAAIGILGFLFKDKISDFFQKGFDSLSEGLVNIDLPDISLPDITFPDFNFPDFFPQFPTTPTGGSNVPGTPTTPEELNNQPPDVPNTGLLTPSERDLCQCGTSIIQDIQGDVQEKCIICQGQTEGPFVKTPAEIAEEQAFINSLNPPAIPIAVPIFMPPIELPAGFEGGGPSFIGGSINPVPLCNKSIGQIAEEFGISASAAANMKFIECEESSFDFGTNTGSGIGPNNPDNVVTGGATLESEEKKAACLTCELFGLNCGICSGSI